MTLLMSAGCGGIPKNPAEMAAERAVGIALSQAITVPPLGKVAMTDSVVSTYLTRIFSRLLNTTRHDFDGTVIVLNDITTAQAMSLPGGILAVYSGLLCDVQSEDELVGVVAHELGHDVRHDAFSRIKQEAVIGGLTVEPTAIVDALRNRDPAWQRFLVQQAGALLTGVDASQKWPQQETDADRDAPGYARRYGSDPCALKYFLVRHQATEERVGNVQTSCDQLPTSHYVGLVSDLRAAKQHLACPHGQTNETGNRG